MSYSLPKVIKSLILIVFLLPLSTPSFAATNTMGIDFDVESLLSSVIPSTSVMFVQSKTDSGASISAKMQTLLLLNLSVSSTQLANETLNNAYFGITIPLLFFGESSFSGRTFISFNRGEGDKGKVDKYGVSYFIDLFNGTDEFIGMLTLNRVNYASYSQFDNTQFGVTVYYMPDF